MQDPWLSSSMRIDEWKFPKADSLGAVPVTWKTQMGASYERYSKRGTCTRCQHSPDPPGAMHASFLKRDIDEHYMKFIHETQCGCAKGRGTCRAGQIVELAANFSKGRGMCWGRLYLDLRAAFDSSLREFLIADGTYNVQLLQSSLKALNISNEMCDQIVRDHREEPD